MIMLYWVIGFYGEEKLGMKEIKQKTIEVAIEGSKVILDKVIDHKEGDLSSKEALKISMELDRLINAYMKMDYDDDINVANDL